MKELVKKFNELYRMLSIDIYQGKKAEEGMKSVPISCFLVSIILIIIAFINFSQGNMAMGVATLIIAVSVLGGGLLVIIFDNRIFTKLITWIAGAVILTVFTIKGSNDGFAMLWVLIYPMFYMYIYDVRWGIALSLYFEVLLISLFYTPLRQYVEMYYSDTFMARFPVFYLCAFLVSATQMIQHHINTVRQSEYEDALERAVEEERNRVYQYEIDKKRIEVEQVTKMEFLANLSHEIKTPLNTIVGMNEMIRKESKSDNIVEYAKNADEASKELMAYIENLLHFSKINSQEAIADDNLVGPFRVNLNENVDLGGLRVLAVDDFKTNLMVIENYLKDTNCELSTCVSGAEAIRLCNRVEFDVILMDHMMPEIDGIQVTKTIRGDITNPNNDSWIVALTANPDRELFMKTGFDDYLSKPIRYNTLIELLEEHTKNYLNDKHKNDDAITVKNGDEPMKESLENATININDMSDEIDIKEAMEYCLDDNEFYGELIDAFLEEYDANIVSLKECINNGDYENCKILVHGLKNAARTIGALKFSEKSKEFEYAIRDGKNKYVSENMDAYIELYTTTKDKLNQVRLNLS